MPNLSRTQLEAQLRELVDDIRNAPDSGPRGFAPEPRRSTFLGDSACGLEFLDLSVDRHTDGSATALGQIVNRGLSEELVPAIRILARDQRGAVVFKGTFSMSATVFMPPGDVIQVRSDLESFPDEAVDVIAEFVLPDVTNCE
jgi:hypothetical protein